MKVLLIGSGGREHAIAYLVSKSLQLTDLFIAPGNPGTALLGNNINLNINDNNIVVKFCKEKEIDLVIVGPEQPLVSGIADILRTNKIKVFGPNSSAADIEAHKSFAKDLMSKYSIPTASYREFDMNMAAEALDYLKTEKFPKVIKADGLAAGKGVIICKDYNEAESAIEEIFEKKVFGSSGNKIVIEEFLEGEEASIFAVTDGIDYLLLPAAQDHKRIGNNDTGKNTGGMGSYSPAPLITPELLNQIEVSIIEPTLKAMDHEGRRFIGCLYAGLMITDEGPKVIEFNCRFGDPETQCVLPLLKGDFLELLYSAASGTINKNSVSSSGGSSVCVVAASKGYPDSYQTGFEIKGIEDINDQEIIVFHAGTKIKDDKLVTGGGRVLGITSVLNINDLTRAKKKSYEALSRIHFDGIYYRTDISDKGIFRKKIS